MKKYIVPYQLRKIVIRMIIYSLLVILGIIFIFPLAWMVSTSLKTDVQVIRFPPEWIPYPIDWENYFEAIRLMSFFRSLKNSCIIAFSAVIGALLSSSLVGYGFSRLEWKGRNLFFVLLLSTMMIPYAVTMVPLFIVFKKLGWLNSFKPLIIPSFFGAPFYIFLLRQFFMTIPMDLSDAAKIDGCSELGIYWKIILPLTKPALAVVMIFQFILSWNDFLGPLIYLNDPEKYTLALALQAMRGGQFYLDWAVLMAASGLVTFPIVILFFFTQKYFIEGITLTGIKG
ncbi:L-arabinose transport system permease protein AraQ [subsurface metagenome]